MIKKIVPDYRSFVLDSLYKNERMMKAATWCIAVFELFFAVRGLINYEGYYTEKCYFSLYVFLFTMTVLCLLLLYPGRKMKSFESVYFIYAHIYDVILGVWAIAISLIDVSRGYYPVVFITVMFSLPFFLMLNPVLNIAIIGVGLTGLIAQYAGVTETVSSGYLMNLGVFAVMACLINNLCFRSNYRNYLLDKQLEERSLRDGLTGLYNRRALDKRIDEVLAEAVQSSAIMLDCDFFKTLNDTYGHRFGDECLIKIGELLVAEFGADSYRYGGDEFMVVTTLTNEKVKDKFAAINQKLKELFPDAPVRVTAGLYNVCGNDTAQEIFIRADKALYQAKETCRGTTHIFSEEDMK